MDHFTNTPYTPDKLAELTNIQNRSDFVDLYLRNHAVPDGFLEKLKYNIQPDASFYFNILFRIATKQELKQKFIDGGLYPGEIGIISDTKQLAYKFVDFRTQEEKIAIIGAKSQANEYKDYIYQKLTGQNWYLPTKMPTKLDMTPTVNAKGDKELEFQSYDDGTKAFTAKQSMTNVKLFGARNGQFVLVNSDGTIRFEAIPSKFEDDRIVENINGIATFKQGGVIALTDLNPDLLADINKIINMQFSNIYYTPKVITDINSPIVIDDSFNLTSLSIPLYFSSEVRIDDIKADKFIMDITTNSNDLIITNNMVTPPEDIAMEANTQYRLFKGVNKEIISLNRYANINDASSNSNIAFVASKDDILSKGKVASDDHIIEQVKSIYELYEKNINGKEAYINSIGLDLGAISDNDLYLFNYDGSKFHPNKIDLNTYNSLLINDIQIDLSTNNPDIKKTLVNTFKKYTNVANKIHMKLNVDNNVPIDFNSIIAKLSVNPTTSKLIIGNDNMSGNVKYDITIYRHDDYTLDSDKNDIIIVELETTQKTLSSSEIFLNYNNNKYFLREKDIDAFLDTMHIENIYNLRDNLKGNYTTEIYCSIAKAVAGINITNTGLLIKSDNDITTEHVYNARFNDALPISESDVMLPYKKEVLSYSIEPLAGKVINLNIDELLKNSIGNIFYVYLNTDIDNITIRSTKLDKYKIFNNLSKGKVIIIKLVNILGKHSFTIIDEEVIEDEIVEPGDIRTAVETIDDINLYGKQMTNITGYIDDIRTKEIKNNILFVFDIPQAHDKGINRFFVDKDYFIRTNTIPIYYDSVDTKDINKIEFDCNISVVRTKHALFSILVDIEYKTYLNGSKNIKEDRYSYSIVPSNIMDYELSYDEKFINPEIHGLSICRSITEHTQPLVNYTAINQIIYPTGQFLRSNPFANQYVDIRLNDNEVKKIETCNVYIIDNETGEILLDYTSNKPVTRVLLGEVNIRISITDPEINSSSRVFTSAINFGSFKLKVDLNYGSFDTKTLTTDIYISKNYGKEVVELYFDHVNENGNYISASIANKSENNYGLILFYKSTPNIDIGTDNYIIQDVLDENTPIFFSYGAINSPVFYVLPMLIRNTDGKTLKLADFSKPISGDYIYKVSSIFKKLTRKSFYENNIMSNYINEGVTDFDLSDDFYNIVERNVFTKRKSNSILNFNNKLPFTDDVTLVDINENVKGLYSEFYSFAAYKKVDDNNYYLMSNDGNWYKYVFSNDRIISRNRLLKVYEHKKDDNFIDASIISYGTEVYFVAIVDDKIQIFLTDGITIRNNIKLKVSNVSFLKDDNTLIIQKNAIVPTSLDTTLDVKISANSQVTRDIYFIDNNKVYYKKTPTDVVKELPLFKILI